MKSLSRFLFGELHLRLIAPPEVCAGLLMCEGFPVYCLTPREGALECMAERKVCAHLFPFLDRVGIPYTVLSEKGLVPFLKRAIRRPGLILGLLFGLFCLYQSTNYVWDIEVYGNERLSKGEITDILAENGFEIGVRHTSLDLHTLCNRIPIGNKDIAWISINMMGSVAEIEVVEYKEKDEKEKDSSPSNLVASLSGEIVRFELSSGRAAVSVGQTVEIGQTLVFGYSEKESGLHQRPSSGKVFAKTALCESVFIPYIQTKKEEGKTILLEKRLNILGKEVIFRKNSLQSEQKYDIINDEYRPTVFGVSLPTPVKVTYAKPFSETEFTLSEEEAEEKAKELLLARIHTRSDEVYETVFEKEKREDGVLVRVNAVCVVDIARQVKVREE